MNESSKTRKVRGSEFIKTYFSGRVLDIGCGEDYVVPHAEPFDKKHGDAANILDHLSENSFDTVHSSHCLEHMSDPSGALGQWWRLLRPSGYLVLVVPDEDLYEQGIWPSMFNRDHKVTFRLKPESTWSKCSYNVSDMVSELPGAEIISADVQDHAYCHEVAKRGRPNVLSKVVYKNLVAPFSRKRRLSIQRFDRLNLFAGRMGLTIDQTLGSALAQIQVVARKRDSVAGTI